MVAGGHAFNTSSDTGGKKNEGFGILITLDDYTLDGGKQWKRVPAVEARKRYQLPKEEAKRVVRVSAGMRLRDFAEAVFAEQMAMPVAGSTDAQSIGGLIATDLHSTGHTSGFLSQQLLEVLTLDAKGKPHRFVKDESKAFEETGRWKWIPPSGPAKTFRKLPVCGALGMTGVVVEAVLKLVPAFNFLKDEQFVPRTWAEANIEKLLDPDQTSKLFAYDHVSLYYGGGKGPNIRTIRLNTWKHTKKKPPKDAMRIKRRRELADHIGSAFLPNSLLKISGKIAPVPGSGTTDGASKILVELNKRPRQVLQVNHAFARKLFFQHDEIEVGIPLAPNGGAPDYNIFRRAIKDIQKLLRDQEFKTVIEVRFTPHASEAMLGPGTGGPTCYIELATSLTQYSRDRIVQVFHKFDDLMRNNFKARPHLGKKTSATADDLEALYRSVWREFSEVRKRIDPLGKFRPKDNELLNRLFP